MTERGSPCAAVRLGDGRFRAGHRRACCGNGYSSTACPAARPAGEVVDASVPTAVAGRLGRRSADPDARPQRRIPAGHRPRPAGCAASSPRGISPSPPTTGGVSIHEQVRRASTVAELQERIRRVPAVLDDLLSRQLASGKVITVYSAIVDTIVRRAITLIFEQHPELSLDAFTWLSLGSNGRREAVAQLRHRFRGGLRRLRPASRARSTVTGRHSARINRPARRGRPDRRRSRRDRGPPRVRPNERLVAGGGSGMAGGARRRTRARS